jgi:hypothetical protein
MTRRSRISCILAGVIIEWLLCKISISCDREMSILMFTSGWPFLCLVAYLALFPAGILFRS